MNVLVLGGGGREHALCWTLDRAPSVRQILCAPGNPGIAEVARCVDLDPTDPSAVTHLAIAEGVNLVVIGPEAPLVAGVADALRDAGVAVFGPSQQAAQLEASKTLCKDAMQAAGVPTAEYWSGTEPDAAKAALDRFTAPYVVKADGLAEGKGVRICSTRAEAELAIEDAMVHKVFGDAGARLVIEEYLTGPEISAFALADGTDCAVFATARDYKRAYDGDEGLNTGGMGAVSPAPDLPDGIETVLTEQVFKPITAEMGERGTPYVGVLYAGMVLTSDGPKVLEFNARFGDPEAQAVLPRLLTDLGLLLSACADGELADFGPLVFDNQSAVTVVLASGGYPADYEKGLPISGLVEASAVENATVFHAGTARRNGNCLTNGGRVLSVTALGRTQASARRTAYEAADQIDFGGLHRRSDIAAD